MATKVSRFSEAISFQVFCDSQDEVDHFWNKLGEGGEEGPCGWLEDKFGPLMADRTICAA